MQKTQKKITTAIILCGGRGTRINKYTKFIPKSLIKVNGYALIWFAIKLLLKNNVKKIIFPLGYKGQKIKEYILNSFPQNKDNFSFVNTGIHTEIHFRIKKIKELIGQDDNFFLVNSDTIYDFNLKKIIKLHLENKFLITVSSANMRSTWGSFVIKKNSNYLKYFNKEDYLSSYAINNNNKYSAYRNSGISIINKKCIDELNFNDVYDFEISLYNKYAKNRKVGFHHFNGFWHPIETVKDLELTKNSKNIEKTIKKLIIKLS